MIIGKHYFRIALVLILLLAGTQQLRAYEKAIVRNVVDGDTIKILYQGQKESIRLIGIDTPECRINQKALRDADRSHEDIQKITSMGKEAANYVKGIVQGGDSINIEFDVQKRDKYRRLLGYVYLSDGRMLNEQIVQAG